MIDEKEEISSVPWGHLLQNAMFMAGRLLSS